MLLQQPTLAANLLHAQKLEKDFKVLDLHHIPRVDNIVIDDLSTKASTWAPVTDGVFKRRLQQPTARLAIQGEGGGTGTSKPAVLIPWSLPRTIGFTGDSVHPSVQDPEAQVSPNIWITEIQTYLKNNILPDDSAFADQIVRLAKRYTLVKGDLYRRCANGILMQCITHGEGC
jgi:hypothetical protein